MSDLIRVVYISRATFEESPADDGLEPHIARILATSRANNSANGLVGMLYYGDGCFFQCIEGETSKVQSLYRTLMKDSRHHELKLLANEGIKRLTFPSWSMKFVPADQHMSKLLEEHGFEHFDPYRFDHHLVERVMQLMQGVADPTVPAIEARPSAPASTIDCEERMDNPAVLGPSNSRLAVLMSSAALLISLATLIYVILSR